MLWGAPAAVAAAPAPEDPYLAGYAGAVLEREFKVTRRAVTVDNGVLMLDGAQLAGADRAAVVKTLSNLPGVVRVEVREAASPARPRSCPTSRRPRCRRCPPGSCRPATSSSRSWPIRAGRTSRPSYRYYLNNRDLEHVGAVSFGETIPLIRGNAFADSQWEAGIQAGVFALFQMDAPSKDLLNADYFASLFGTWRRGPFSALGRIFHQSSHLGDELLLRTRLERINLTYESLDLKLSYDLPWGFRVYGGGGFLFDQEPESLKPWAVQGGVEFRSPRTFAAGHVRPVAAVDLQSREENKWNLDVSVRGGIQLENVRVLERNLQLLVEYFHGNSPDGQFYKRRVESLGSLTSI